jgi:formamidopyrimidine-DNA glycosylase
MPELPEVETVCRGLEKVYQGQTITKVEYRRPNLRLPLPKDLPKLAAGKTITHIHRRAKYALIDLTGGQTILLHLGMSGRLVFGRAERHLDKHDHVLLHFKNAPTLIFNDPRRFGVIDVCATVKVGQHPLLKGMGPEPLEKAFDGDYLLAATRGKKGPIKPLIMNNAVVVGVGNIYAAESLFRAGIRPMRPAGSLTKAECAKLVAAIKDVLKAAIKAGGSSIRDYVQSDGTVGYFHSQFMVYGRKGEACKVCGSIIKEILQAGRSGCYCATCQK